MSIPESFRIRLPRACHVVIEGHPLGVGLVHKEREGYTLVYDYSREAQTIGYSATLAKVRKWVNDVNTFMEITPEMEKACWIGAMRGWDHVAAQVENWGVTEGVGSANSRVTVASAQY